MEPRANEALLCTAFRWAKKLIGQRGWNDRAVRRNFNGVLKPKSGRSAGGKKEAEDLVETVGPGGFVVLCAGDAKVEEILAWTRGVIPSALEQAAVEQVGVAEVAEAFTGAHVEPEAEVRFGASAADAVEDGALVPPDAGAHDGGLGEDAGVVEREGEGDEAAEGGAAEGGVFGAGEGAEVEVDEGLELVDEEAAVARAFSAAATGVAGGGVLGHAAHAGVGDADEDDGLDFAGGGEGVGGFVGTPGAAGNERGAGVDEVLAVVEIEDGKVAGGVGEVGFREVDGDVSAAGKEARAEVVEAQVARIIVEVAGLALIVRERMERIGLGGLAEVVGQECVLRAGRC